MGSNNGLRNWEKYTDALHILSLGAGRQSSVMYLMAIAGEIEPLPDYAIFADTGNEPPHVYEQLEYLQVFGNHIVPIIVVDNGNIYDDTMRALDGDGEQVWGGNGTRWVGPPVFSENGGPIRRKCTQHYKIKPKEDEIRRLLKLHDKSHVIDWRGHTIDEIERAKPDKRQYYIVRWPLLEARMTDHACAMWLERNGYREFRWSACEICPFRLRDWQTVRELRQMPDSWQRITLLDERIRDLSQFGVERRVYLNDRYQPMDEFASRPQAKTAATLFDCDGGACGL